MFRVRDFVAVTGLSGKIIVDPIIDLRSSHATRCSYG